MAAPVTKASWMATDTATVGVDVARAIRIATSGRPGPVHLSLPSDILDASVPADAVVWPSASDFTAEPVGLSDAAADAILSLIKGAKRPLLIGAPVLANRPGRALMDRLQDALGIPGCLSEGPRGFNDATLGRYGDVAKRADLIVLLGKALDFTLKFGAEPFFDPSCQFISIDPEGALIDRATQFKGGKLVFGCVADTYPAGEALIRRASGKGDAAWVTEARVAFADRPDSVKTAVSSTPDKVHPAEVFRVLQRFLERAPDSVLICDGGEFAQWGQSILRNDRRMINGVAGSIGSSLPMASGARVAEPSAPVFAVLGDGTFGFHMSELETAVRLNLPYVAIVGTDCRWNAEYNLQVRDYGPNRTHGCELNPTHYELVATALGGHGELVERAADLAPAIERALASGKPSVVNVMIESIPSPVVRR
jgi:acetolactate synthase-1/2/3 large subunit